MDACIPERPTTQCHRCLRRRPDHAVLPVVRHGVRALHQVVIDASTVLVDGRCVFRVDAESLGMVAVGEESAETERVSL